MNKDDIRKMNTASCSICLISHANCATCPFHIYYAQAHPQKTATAPKNDAVSTLKES